MLSGRRIYVVATQHLDVAYLWRRNPEGEELMRQCFEKAIQMIEAFPNCRFVFSRSTAWSFDVLERKHPALFTAVKKYVDAGRIELCGGQWVEPDNILPDGETLVRQGLYGQEYFQSRFGRVATVAWNPDAFAHGDSLPQILLGCGLEGYYFHRCQPVDAAGQGITQFLWQGLDGSHLLVFSGKWRGKPSLRHLQESLVEMDRTGLPMDFIVTGANSDRRVTMEVDWIPDLDQAKAELDQTAVDWASAGDVLAEMRSYADRLPLVRGELGFQFTGTYTSEGNIKRLNRRCEALLIDAEKVSACATLLGYEYPLSDFSAIWRDLCVNNFHDIICGTCYQHVHEEALALYREIERRARRKLSAAISFLANETRVAPKVSPSTDATGHYLVFNPLSWERRSPVTLPIGDGDPTCTQILSSDGRVIPSQAVALEDGSTGLLFLPPAVPGLGCSILGIRPSQRRLEAKPDSGLHLENQYLVAEIDPQSGELERLFDKGRGVELLAAGTRGNRLVFYEDRTPLSAYEPWYIGYTGKVTRPGTVTSVRRVESGPVRCCIRVEGQISLMPNGPLTRIVQEILLYEDLPYLVFQTRGEWHADGVLLRAEFDLSFPCTGIISEMPYGVAERKPHAGDADFYISWDSGLEDGLPVGSAVQEPDRPMHRWLDVSHNSGGLAFLNDGKYGYDASPARVGISLMRAPRHRDGELIGLGPFEFRYALMPHQGNWREAGLPQHGYAFNHELVCMPFQPRSSPRSDAISLDGESFFRVDAFNVLITAIKLAQDRSGIVLRLYESQGRASDTVLSSTVKVTSVSECNLVEAPLAQSSDCHQLSDRQIALRLRPFEVKTLLCRF